MRTILPILADVTLRSNGSGGDLIHNLLVILVVGIAIAIIWWAGSYFIGQLQAPPVALKLWNGLFVLLGVIFVVNFLLSLVGHGFIQF